jgi:hypothetical protein
MEIPVNNIYGVLHAGTVPIIKGNPVRVFATQEAVQRTGAPGSVTGILLQERHLHFDAGQTVAVNGSIEEPYRDARTIGAGENRPGRG